MRNIILTGTPFAVKTVVLAAIRKLLIHQSGCSLEAPLQFIDVVEVYGFLNDTMDREETRPILFDEIPGNQFLYCFFEVR